MKKSSGRVLSGLVLTACGLMPLGAAMATPPAASARPTPPRPVATRIDTRDVRLPITPDRRPGARTALVSQAPLIERVAALSVSGNGRLALVADAEGSLAVVDVESLVVRSARSLLLQPSQTVHFHVDHEGRNALVILVSSDAAVPSDVYGWDLVTDELTKVMSAASLRPELLALASASAEFLFAEAQPSDGASALAFQVTRSDARRRNRRVVAGAARPVAAVGFTPGLGVPYVLEDDGGAPLHIYTGARDFRVGSPPAAGLDPRTAVAFRPNGGQVAVVQGNDEITLCSPVDGSCSAVVRWDAHSPSALGYGLGGNCLIARDRAGAGVLVDATTGDIVAPIGNVTGQATAVGRCSELLVAGPGGRIERSAIDPARRAVGAPRSIAAPVSPASAAAPVSRVAADAAGERVVMAVGGDLVVHDVAAGTSRARRLVGVPGPVTDIAWSADGNQLFVRRRGEVLRASRDGLEVLACEGNSTGRLRADGRVVFGDSPSCVVPAEPAGGGIVGRRIAGSRDGSVAIVLGADGIARADANGATLLWPTAELGCSEGEACQPGAIVSNDGNLAALRYGRAVRVVEIASARVLARVELAEVGGELAFTSDKRTLLIAGGTGGLTSIDLQRGGSRVVSAGARVLLGGSTESDTYVVTEATGVGFRMVDGRTHRDVRIAGADANLGRNASIALLRDGLYIVTREGRRMVVDTRTRRAVAIDGTPMDAVRTSSGHAVAVCRDETMSVLAFEGSGAGRRIGQVGGCSRIRRVALRADGTAVAVAAGDAAIVVQTPGTLPPLILRSQLDREGRSRPVAWAVGRAFAADDSVVDAIRARRAGPVGSAEVAEVVTDAQRQPGVHADYFR